MPTIREENKKPLRKALDVIVGIDVGFIDEIPDYSLRIMTDSGSLEPVGTTWDWDITSPLPRIPLMDLYGEGFLNDGRAVPYYEEAGRKEGIRPSNSHMLVGNEDGRIAKLDGTTGTLIIELTDGTRREFSVLANGKMYHSDTGTELSGPRVVISEWTPCKRVILDRICFGHSMMWTNDRIISCKLTLRGVETKAAEPKLQESQIDLEVYEPEDLSDFIGSIPEDTPIWYMAGYETDMSPLRHFYIDDVVQQDGSVLSLSGVDGTKFLEEEYADYKSLSNGVHTFVNAAVTALGNTDYQLIDTWQDSEYHSQGASQILVDNRTRRDVIASLVNLLRLDVDENPIYLGYVDAGIPTLTTERSTDVYEISDTSIIKRDIERKEEYELINYGIIATSLSSTEIEQVEFASEGVASQYVMRKVSEPYSRFTASSGTINMLDPYRYELTKGTSNVVTVSGTKLLINESAGTGIKNASNLYIMVSAGGRGINSIHSNIIQALNARSNILHTFTWRGDPHLQPRDYIRVNGIDMTIDTLTLEHENGGLTSSITAREGFI